MRTDRGTQEAGPELTTAVTAVTSTSTRVRVTGELDVATAQRFATALAEVISARRPNVVIDASGLRFCDSAGLAALELVGGLAEACDGAITVTRARPIVARILEFTGLDSRFLHRAPAS